MRMPEWVCEHGNIIYLERRLLGALCLALGNFATFFNQSRSKATVDVYGCGIYHSSYIHTCVGFCVARSDWLGNAKAS